MSPRFTCMCKYLNSVPASLYKIKIVALRKYIWLPYKTTKFTPVALLHFDHDLDIFCW